MNENESHQISLGKIYMAMGYFLIFFGVIVLISIFFTDSFIGKMTNLGAGLTLTLISVAMIYYGFRTKRNGELHSKR
jgi:hypothetical protein